MEVMIFFRFCGSTVYVVPWDAYEQLTCIPPSFHWTRESAYWGQIPCDQGKMVNCRLMFLEQWGNDTEPPHSLPRVAYKIQLQAKVPCPCLHQGWEGLYHAHALVLCIYVHVYTSACMHAHTRTHTYTYRCLSTASKIVLWPFVSIVKFVPYTCIGTMHVCGCMLANTRTHTYTHTCTQIK